MNRFVKASLLAMLVCFASVPIFAQSVPTRTTLSTALFAPGSANGQTANVMVVASATGIVAPAGGLPTQRCMIDKEVVNVRTVNSTTIGIARNQQGYGVGHASGATVVCGYTASFNTSTGTISSVVGNPSVGGAVAGGLFVPVLPTGSCVRASNSILPVFYVPGDGSEVVSTVDCNGGQWIAGTAPDNPPAQAITTACNVPIGSVAYGSLGTNTADVVQEWETSIYVPQTAWITGVKVLAGATATTDKILAILRDSKGISMATAALAGVTLSGADTFQTQAFIAPRLVVGPALYYVGVQGNGTAAGAIRTVAASTFNNIFAGLITAATFGTVAADIAEPTTFTADKGPIVCLYN